MRGIERISVIMVDGSFREKFHMVDYLNKQTLPKDQYELIWVEFYSEVNEELKKKPNLRIITLNNSEDTPYHSSYCFNKGIEESKGDLLVIIDADQVVEPTFLETIKKEHEKCDELVMYMQRWDEPKEKHHPVKSYELDYLKSVCRFLNPVNYGGCLTVRKKWLLKINGYEKDPLFGGLHANGRDCYTRFKNLGLHIKWHPTERMYHPWHPGTLAPSETYTPQLSIIRKRELNLTWLPNYGLDPSRDKEVKDLPDALAGSNTVKPQRKIGQKVYQVYYKILEMKRKWKV
jgi:hypothetical protein